MPSIAHRARGRIRRPAPKSVRAPRHHMRPSREIASSLFFRWSGPGPDRSVFRLEGRDLRAIALGQVDVVPAIEQLIAADRVDREREGYAGTADGLPFEVDGDLLRRRLAYHGGQLLDVRLRGDRGEQPVLHGILRKDIAERRCDDAT